MVSIAAFQNWTPSQVLHKIHFSYSIVLLSLTMEVPPRIAYTIQHGNEGKVRVQRLGENSYPNTCSFIDLDH